MKKLFKITPEVHKKIISEAAKLPKMHKIADNGKPIIQTNTILKSSTLEGVKGIRNQFDIIKTHANVNHEIELYLCYKHGGPDAFDEYIKLITGLKAISDKEEKEKQSDAKEKENMH